MPILLSLSQNNDQLWAAGPDGLFRVHDDAQLEAVLQPQQELACCAVTDSTILVGGAPHGVAFSPDAGASWQAAWMDGVDGPVLCMAADPRIAETGVLLAGSATGGILRSHNRGNSWSVCNFGLQDYVVLALAWAPEAPPTQWPKWQVVFAGTEAGIYRSPNGGLGWRRVDGLEAVVQTIAVAADFHTSGVVLAGTEDDGLWRSSDGGRTFTALESAPARIDALTATADGWLLSSETSLWQSIDGVTWRDVAGSEPALALLQTGSVTWCAGESGLLKR